MSNRTQRIGYRVSIRFALIKERCTNIDTRTIPKRENSKTTQLVMIHCTIMMDQYTTNHNREKINKRIVQWERLPRKLPWMHPL